MTEYEKARRYVELHERVESLQITQGDLEFKDPSQFNELCFLGYGDKKHRISIPYKEIKVAVMDAIKDVLTKEKEKAIKELKEIKIDGKES